MNVEARLDAPSARIAAVPRVQGTLSRLRAPKVI